MGTKKQHESQLKITIERRKIDKWDALIIFNKEDEFDTYTISYEGVGGAVVSDKDLIKAEGKFIEAMNLSESVLKFIHFQQYGVFPNKLKTK